MEKQFCNNCGNFGHVYSNCRHPILSYGILLFHIDEKNIQNRYGRKKRSLILYRIYKR